MVMSFSLWKVGSVRHVAWNSVSAGAKETTQIRRRLFSPRHPRGVASSEEREIAHLVILVAQKIVQLRAREHLRDALALMAERL